MQHLDDDQLIELAIDQLPNTSYPVIHQAALDHLTQCPQCTEALAEWGTAVTIGRAASLHQGSEPAAANVWEAILADIAEGASHAFPDPSTDHGAELPQQRTPLEVVGPPRATKDSGTTERTKVGEIHAGNAGNVVVGLTPKALPRTIAPAPKAAPEPRSRWAVPLLAAAAAAVIASGATYLATRSDSATTATAPSTVEAIADLNPVKQDATPGSLGTADLLSTPDSTEVVVDAVGLPAIAGAYEVWLFGDDGRMVSLGVLHDGHGTFTVPQGISPREYKVLDISNEPADGNPAHSKNSVARGKFA
ncbi:anti-sigma factor [Nakamurella antarctica]|uniref:Anti-sigma factor n=1 Tax=Nakamurella antarctica TaxID=1902245 RepID=A0A3G8ZPB6_9ACTN|nr:anti-sigma factor [Nakamurella antarctica]AZI59079.1 anti-sigma factor [Nakamurella antarctica]